MSGMEITYLGHSSFKIINKTTSVLTDPFDPQMLGVKFAPQSADIVTISHDHKDHNNASAVSGYKKILSGPGEYEINGVSFIGINSFHDNEEGKQRGINTIFIIEMNDFRLAHLGDLGHKLSDKTLNTIGDIDVLMIPIGGKYTINSAEAVEIVRDIEPKIIIPMHYQLPGATSELEKELETVDQFITTLGCKVEHLPKLTLREGAPLAEDQTIALLAKK